MGAVQLDHLPHVPEVMKGKLVEQLVEAKHAKLFVPSGATTYRSRKGVQPLEPVDDTDSFPVVIEEQLRALHCLAHLHAVPILRELLSRGRPLS